MFLDWVLDSLIHFIIRKWSVLVEWKVILIYSFSNSPSFIIYHIKLSLFLLIFELTLQVNLWPYILYSIALFYPINEISLISCLAFSVIFFTYFVIFTVWPLSLIFYLSIWEIASTFSISQTINVLSFIAYWTMRIIFISRKLLPTFKNSLKS